MPNSAAPRRAVRRSIAVAGITAITALGLGGLPAGAEVDDDGNVVIDIVGINDFHGRISEVGNPLENPDTPRHAARLASAVEDIRDENEDTLFVSAGDNIGGTTFVSMVNDDVPTLEVLEEMGLVASALGNHEFDRGREALQARIDEPQFSFPYLGANVEVPDGAPEFRDYHVEEVVNPAGDPVRVGFIGVLTEDMESLVAAEGIAGMEFTDMSEAARRVATELTDGDEANGEADVVVVLAHEGASSGEAVNDDSTKFGSLVADLAAAGTVDAVFSGHTHVGYTTAVGDMPVIQTPGLGTELGRITLSYDPDTDDVITATTERILLTGNSRAEPAIPPYPVRTDLEMIETITQIVREAESVAEEIGGEPVGEIDRNLNRAVQSDGTTENRGGESTIGNLIADAQLWAAQRQAAQVNAEPPVIAFMNPGGIRADIQSEDGIVTYADVATAQPFGNTLVTMELTGADIIQVLEEQWQPDGADRPFLKLGVSAGLFYFYDPQAPAGERVSGVVINGEEISEDATYPVVTNSFLGSGVGDNFFAFGNGTNRADSGLIDLTAFVDYFAENEVVEAPLDQRAIGVHWVSDRQAAYVPGDEVAIDLSSLSFSTDEPKPEELTLSLRIEETAEAIQLDSVTVDNTVVDTTDEVGRAKVRVTIPELEGLSATPVEWQLVASDATSGYEYWFGVYLAAAEEEPPTPTPTPEPTTPAPTPPPTPTPTPTAPGGGLPSTGAETNGPLVAGAAFILLGTLLVAGAALHRRRALASE